MRAHGVDASGGRSETLERVSEGKQIVDTRFFFMCSHSSLLETTSSSVPPTAVEMPPGPSLHGPRLARSAGTQEKYMSLGTGPRQSPSESFRGVEMDANRVSSYVARQKPSFLSSPRGLAENAAARKNDRRRE